MCKSVSGPIFGLCWEHLSILSRIIGFIRSQTRRNASGSTIAEANLDDTRSIFVRSCERSTTYRVKRLSMWSSVRGVIEQLAPGGGYSIYLWVGRCGTAPHTLTLFKTNIADFPTLLKTEFRFFNTLFKTFNPNIN